MSGAQKHDQGKIRMELIPGDALVSLAEVLTFGARKYTERVSGFEKVLQWMAQKQNVSIILKRMPGGAGYVGVVTSNDSAPRIQSMLSGSVLIGANGIGAIPSESKTTNVAGSAPPNMPKNAPIDDYKLFTESRVPNGLKSSLHKVVGALSAGAQSIFIPITITIPDGFGGFSAVGAITASDFLMTLSKVFKKPWTISGENLEAPGSWNWAKGFDWMRLYGAAQRHLTSWQSGDDKDPETGFSHLAHAFCCIAFLIVHEKRGLGKDDRHRFEQAAEEVMAAHHDVLKALADCPACGGARFVWADGTCDTKIDCGVCEP